MPENTGRRPGDPARPPFAEAKKRGGTFEGWTPKQEEATMGDRIEIITRKNRYGYYVSTVRVNGHFYAEFSCRDRETAIAEATRYAAQIGFDEFGDW